MGFLKQITKGLKSVERKIEQKCSNIPTFMEKAVTEMASYLNDDIRRDLEQRKADDRMMGDDRGSWEVDEQRDRRSERSIGIDVGFYGDTAEAKVEVSARLGMDTEGIGIPDRWTGRSDGDADNPAWHHGVDKADSDEPDWGEILDDYAQEQLFEIATDVMREWKGDGGGGRGRGSYNPTNIGPEEMYEYF
jgi:hypothetical protein